MAQVLFSKDGQPIDDLNALPVKIAGASDGATGAVGVNVKGAEAIVATDMQARLVNTAVTHTGQLVANGGSSAQATWTAVPEGMSEFINNLTADAALATIFTHVYWSEDGTAVSGKSLFTVSNSIASLQKTADRWLPIGGAFYKTEVINGDAAPHTCSANIKFRA